jgi:hypothetical protein
MCQKRASIASPEATHGKYAVPALMDETDDSRFGLIGPEAIMV